MGQVGSSQDNTWCCLLWVVSHVNTQKSRCSVQMYKMGQVGSSQANNIVLPFYEWWFIYAHRNPDDQSQCIIWARWVVVRMLTWWCILWVGNHVDRYKLNIVVVVICDPRVINLISIVCGSSPRFHRQCMYIHRKTATSIPPEAHKVNYVISFIHMSIWSV